MGKFRPAREGNTRGGRKQYNADRFNPVFVLHYEDVMASHIARTREGEMHLKCRSKSKKQENQLENLGEGEG